MEIAWLITALVSIMNIHTPIRLYRTINLKFTNDLVECMCFITKLRSVIN